MTIGERLKAARKEKGFSQDTLADAIGVTRGVIQNLEYNRAEAQPIVINAICQTLNINKDWLVCGKGEMYNTAEMLHSAKVLAELYDIVKDFSEDEQLFFLDTVKAMQKRILDKSK